MANWLDEPLDPGNAFTEISGNGEFKYAIVCHGRRHFTNSKKRFKRHYRIASRRGLAGTWLKWNEYMGCYHWWRIRLSDAALGL